MPIYYHTGQFPPKHLQWNELIPYLGIAAAAVARYDGILAAIPNPEVLLSPLGTQEAVFSSRIEGTQATMGEVLEYEADENQEIPSARREDIHEVLNYRRAMMLAEAKLRVLPLSLRLLKETHAVLMDGVRGHGKSPGDFRKIPSWIGPPGCSIDQARFVPPDAMELLKGLSTWESYLHQDAPDKLIQLAVIHAEFEALHPFLDGNGRLGRMLIPLFLWQQGLIGRPMFYMSAYLEARRSDYYEHLLGISKGGRWTAWCRFFLEGMTQQAKENMEKAQAILNLYNELKHRAIEVTRSQYAIHALDWIFNRPIFRSTGFVADVQIPNSTARRILNSFKQEGLIKEMKPSAGSRPAILAFSRLLNIAEGRDIF